MSKLKYTKIFVTVFIAVAVIAVAGLTLSILISEKVFSTKLKYKAKFSDATGLKGNVPVIYKGFKIGYINDIELAADNNVYADLLIYEEYEKLMNDNCILYKSTNPITSVTNILFLTGTRKGNVLKQGALIPGFDTYEGKVLQRQHSIPFQGDAIGSLMFKVESILDELSPQMSDSAGASIMDSFAALDTTFKRINSIVTNVDETMVMVKDGLKSSKGGVFGGLAKVDDLMTELTATTKNARTLMVTIDETLVNYKKPDSLAIKMIDPTGENFLKPVQKSLASVNELLPEINRLLVYTNDQTTNISLIQEKIKKVLDDFEVTLEILNRNPLINFNTDVGKKKVEQGKKRPR
ncbi:MAG: hypothetical protein AMXMBFR49_04430 [Chlorobiota bacterium]|nr:MAG: MCE family protein [Chlorobiota bacterium]